jgi:hypothetical protein
MIDFSATSPLRCGQYGFNLLHPNEDIHAILSLLVQLISDSWKDLLSDIIDTTIHQQLAYKEQ